MSKAEDKRIINGLAKSLDRYNRFITDIYNLSKQYEMSNKQCYGFVPYPYTLDIVKTLLAIYIKLHKHQPKFLDIGCGIGNIVQIAYGIGFDAKGLECNTKIYNMALRLVSPYIEIIKGDMLEFKKYHEYDILYYYQPIINSEPMSKFAKKLVREMKFGAYVIPCGTSFPFKESRSFQRAKFNGLQTYKKMKGELKSGKNRSISNK